jgi:hypothetical protein
MRFPCSQPGFAMLGMQRQNNPERDTLRVAPGGLRIALTSNDGDLVAARWPLGS